ncbi:MAG TPA: hypothetical protein VFX11_09030 [Candidatus Kapabacteria bacterium]|nr:hypothetical protein [Candidatus Kapabacteria bacterium]
MLEYSENNVAWVAYCAGAVGCLLVWWRMTRILPWSPLRQLLRILVAALLLVPAPVAPGREELAPAFVVLLFDTTLVKQGDPLHAAPYLIYGLMLGLVILVIDGFVRFMLSRRHA